MESYITFQMITYETTDGQATRDCRNFNEWAAGKKTTLQCIEEFCVNNEAYEEIYTIDPEQFERWLWSLNYRREKAK